MEWTKHTYDLYDDSEGMFSLFAGNENSNEMYPDSEFPIFAMINMNVIATGFGDAGMVERAG